MRKLHKPAALLLALVVALGLTVTALAEEETGYTDVAGTWAEEYVSRVARPKVRQHLLMHCL